MGNRGSGLGSEAYVPGASENAYEKYDDPQSQRVHPPGLSVSSLTSLPPLPPRRAMSVVTRDRGAESPVSYGWSKPEGR